jgi:hypothetical protein
MRFQVDLPQQAEARFTQDRLQEVVLRGAGLQYTLSLSFVADGVLLTDGVPVEAVWPQYVVLKDEEGLPFGPEVAKWAMFMKEQGQSQAGEFF